MAVSLNRVQAEDYIRRVDEELRQQRRRLLALDTPLAILLPQHLRGLSIPLVANYIAERLLFMLAACTGRTAALRRSTSSSGSSGEAVAGELRELSAPLLPAKGTHVFLPHQVNGAAAGHAVRII